MNTKMKMLGVAVLSALALAGCSDDKKTEAKAEHLPIVGIVQIVEHPALDAACKGIMEGMKENGMKVEFDHQNAQADQSNLANIAQRFVMQKYPLVFAIATPAAQTMANATKTTPIVATAVTDFEVARLVQSNAKPGTNVTGSSDLNPVGQQLDLIMKIVPTAKTIGTIYNSSEINSQFQIDILKKELERYSGVKLVEMTVSSVNDVQQIATSLVGKVDAIYVPTDNVIASAMPILAQVTTPHKIPVVTGEEGMCRGGGLATVGVDYFELGKIAGAMGAEIMSGKNKPENMAIRYQKSFKAIINEATMKSLGITLPAEVMQGATLVK